MCVGACMCVCVCVCVAKPVAVELRCHATALIANSYGLLYSDIIFFIDHYCVGDIK